MMKLKRIKLNSVPLFLVSGLFISCIQEQVTLADLNISATGFKKTIVIQGVISSELEKQRVLLSLPNDWDAVETVYVNDANVSLSNGTETFAYKRTEREGEYASIDSIRGVVGSTYTLDVIYDNQNYIATDSMVAALPITEREKDILQYNFDDFFPTKLIVRVHNFGFSRSSFWGFFSPIRSSWAESTLNTAYSISTYDVSHVVYSHLGSPPQGVFSTPRGFGPYHEITETDSIEYIKCSVSPKHYKYIIEVLNVTHWDGGLFTTVPGNAKSNVSNGGYGYFFAADVRRERFMIGDLIND